MDPEIVISSTRLPSAELRRLVDRHFGDMVKYVVDVERGVAAVGGEMHADAEALLLEDGSDQRDLWGGNYFPGRGPEGCIQHTALINIRPAQENRAMEVSDPVIRERIRDIIRVVIGDGEEVP